MTQGPALVPRKQFLVVAVAVLLLAAFMPTGWYDAIPRRSDLSPLPFRGVSLLRLTLAVEGTLLLWLAGRRRGFALIADRDRLSAPTAFERDDPAAELRARWLLVGITLLALVLRVIALDADLWLDEITPILDYGPLPIAQVIGSYLRSNNHLLNTLLLKGTVALWGEHEWSVRLPAVLFGVATIPAVYLVARQALSRAVSLGAALLLAVSYHHIFFSQNARGYSAYLFFGVVASGLFVKALRTDRPSTWVWYVATIVLGFASLLNTLFVGAAHGVVVLLALAAIRRKGGAAAPLCRRMVAVFGAAGFLGLQLYASALPEVIVVINSVYAGKATGFAPFSLEFLREIVRGVSAGFGPGLLVAAVPFLAVAAAGYYSLLRRNWPLALALALPGVLTALFLAVRGLTFSPRFFLLWLPLAMMAAAQGVWLTAERAARALAVARAASGKGGSMGTAFGVSALLLLAAVSLIALPRYYATPKQAYRAALRHVESLRRPGDRIAVIHTAEKGVRYYLARLKIDEGAYRFVRTVPAFDSLRAESSGGRLVIVTTFRRALRLNIPELNDAIERGWTPDRVFRGTVGDGSVAVWLPYVP